MIWSRLDGLLVWTLEALVVRDAVVIMYFV